MDPHFPLRHRPDPSRSAPTGPAPLDGPEPPGHRSSRHHMLLRVAVVVVAHLFAAGLVVLGPGAASPAAGGTAVDLTRDEQAQLDLVNRYRRRQGASPLVVDARAQADARAWARHLGDQGRVAHDPELGADCAAASESCSAWAENVGSAGSHQRVFELFVDSEGHARNLRLDAGPGEDHYRVGIGVHRTGRQVTVVHRFYRCDCDNDALARRLNQQRAEHLALGAAWHEDFLGRSGDESSVDALAAPLAYGVDRRSVVVGLAYSDAWVGALVDRLYRTTFGRSADADGLRFWTRQVRDGGSTADVAASFFASDEYHARVGGTDRAWVRALYEELLDREADPGGVDHWVAERHRIGRFAVARVLHQSVESRRRRVLELYQQLLGRRPDAAGLSHWVGRLAHRDDVTLAIELGACEEYRARAVERAG